MKTRLVLISSRCSFRRRVCRCCYGETVADADVAGKAFLPGTDGVSRNLGLLAQSGVTLAAARSPADVTAVGCHCCNAAAVHLGVIILGVKLLLRYDSFHLVCY